MDEFGLIRSLFAPLAGDPGADGLRDDVAEIISSGRLIATADTIVESVHFLPDDPIATVAKKLLRVNVSDIIAKGGRPAQALLSLVWPRGRDRRELADFARSLGDDLNKWGARLVGGDTTSTVGPLVLSLTLLGSVGERGPVRRSGAQVGDDIWVSGEIGNGWLGLQAATGKLQLPTVEAKALLVSWYRTPQPPSLKLADLVAAQAHASIDVSDGLVADAGHLAEASSVAVVIEAASVPLSAVGQNYVDNGRASLADLLTGGDDYQTLFTAPSSARDAITGAGLPLTRIGRVEQGADVRLLDASGGEMPIAKAGYNHFGA